MRCSGMNKAIINFATASTFEIIQGITGSTIRIHAIYIRTAGNQTLIFKEGTTAFTGAMSYATASVDQIFPCIAIPIASGQSFNITSSAAVQTSGFVIYSITKD